MQKTTFIVLFSFFNLLFLQANNKPETNFFDLNFDVTVSLIGEVEVDYHDYDFTATYEWQFEYGPIGFKTGEGKTITVSGWPYYNFKLDPLKGYDFRIRANNLVNNALVWTDWSQTKTIFATSDKVFSVGYTANFDDSKATNLEWRGLLYNNSTSDAGIGFSTGNNHSANGDKGSSVYMANYNYDSNSYIGFVSPRFNDLATDRKIKFWTYGYYPETELLVGTMTDPNDFNTFHLLAPVEVKTGGGWQPQTIYLNNYKGTDQYIVFFFKSKYYGADSNEVYLDDFSYEKASDCFDQTNFAVTNIEQKSVQISFDAPNENNFQVSLTNVAKHTTEIFNIQSSPFTINNLVGNTDYQVKVRANCIDDLFSNWTKTIPFKTPCTVISDSYSTSFEGTNYIDPCWSVIANNCLVRSSLENVGGSTRFTPKTGDATIIISKFVSTLNVDKAYLITPYIADLDADKRVRFSLLTYSGSYKYHTSSLTIGTMSDPKDASTFIALKTILPSEMNEIENLNKSSLWKEHTVYLDNYLKTNNHHYIALRYNNESESEFSIDDFVYEKASFCLEPLNPRTTSFGYDFATVTWDNYKPATEWQIEYGPKGFEHGTGTIVTANTFPFKITESVLDDTEYDFYVRNKCGNDYSGWSDKGYFKTKCIGVTAGYKEDFETFAFEKNGCWTRIVPNFTVESYYTKNDFIDSPKQSAPNYLVHSGLRSICLLNKPDVLFPGETKTEGNSDRIVLISPRLKDFDHYKKISFWLSTRQQSSQAPAELIVGTMSDPDDATTFTPYRVVAIPVTSHDKMIKYEIEFSDYYGTDKFIAFKQSKINVRLTDFFLDDFEYNQNECIKPGLLGARQSGSDIATLDWRDNNTKKPSESWDIEYGPKGFADGSGTIINVKTNPANLTGLAQGIYDCRVRAYCEAGIASDWSDRYTFKIGCTEKAPFVENFDQYQVLNEIPGFCWTKNSFMDTQLLECYLTNINSSPNVFYLQNNRDTPLLVSPYLEDFDKDKKIKFWLNGQLTSSNIKSGDLVIGTIKNPLDISTFEPYQTISVEELKNLPKYGKEVNVDFSKYKGSNKQIAFMFKLNDDIWSGTNRVLIDDFNYDQTLSCYEPIDVVFSNINNNSVQINWTSKNALPEKVEIEYGATGFTPGMGTILNTTANEIKVSNLQSGISYQFYFKTVCDAGNSIVVGPKKIETTCSVKTLPWIEKFSNLPAYGKDVLPDCFKLLHGSLTLENTAVEEVFSNYSPDYLRDGFDDHSYIYLRGDFWTDFMAPMFHLEAGTTYKFSVQGRNSYEYRTQGIGLSAGRGQNAYNMETRLGGTGRLTEYNYSEVVSYFTPVVSGDYSFLMDFSNSGAPNLLADNFELKEGYKVSVDGNKNSTVYDFQKGITDDIILEDTFDASCEIGFDDQSAANKVVVMSKGSSGSNWVTTSTNSNSGKTNENAASIWELNQSNISKVNTKIDAKNAASLFMSFELKQRFVDHNTESMFRVIVNGNVLGDVIKPVTNKADSFQKYMFDLTPYVGSEIRISLQHIGKTDFEDTAFLDNLTFAKTVENLSVVENKITDFKYYPNPIENILNIESNSIISNLEVYNLNGQLLFESKYSDAKIAVDFKRYATGVYLVVLKQDDKKETFKVIKK
ncbi:fibronectin type III domain-containing protein [Flavobacterium pectinovorum]|uniref:T9SS C-terminal target domain-containing protein n=1 Tax=Flavobacterium pectinovorum TaxID=29533 RepID=A0A502EQK1_9FLAO|nr:fibronectin type III domain-containing protein [Flavobacterium pectinovorum]TPG38776.1 T9SS C-terminal target domain-containing protein [Flavobacterium pectinovorum]